MEEILCLAMNIRLMQEYLLEVEKDVLENGTGSISSLEDSILWVEKIEKKEG